MALSDNARGAIYMSVAMAGFTLNDACIKAATVDMPLFQAIFLRGSLTVLALLTIALVRGGLVVRVAPPDLRALGWRTVGEVLGTITFLVTLQRLEFANLSAIMQALPLAVALAAAVFLGEPLGWRRLLAIGVGFAGVLMIVRPGTAGFDQWALLGLVSVGFVVLRDLATRRLSAAVPSVTVALLAAVSVTFMGAAMLPFTGWITPDLRHWAQLSGASAFLVGGYLFAVMVMRVGDIGFVAPFRYTALLWAIVLGWLAFGQFPDVWTVVGAGIVIATGLFTFYRERQASRRAIRDVALDGAGI